MLRRYGRLAVVVAALLGAVAVLAAVRAASDTGHEHRASGHEDAVVLCVAVGGCVLAVAGGAVAIRRVAHKPLWLLAAPLVPTRLFIPALTLFPARAGPPLALLQVFRI
jgi:uncharacterized membrane protein